MNNQEIYLNLHPVNFLIISGIIQGFILSGIIFFKKTDYSLPSKLLSLTILVVNMHLTYLMILDLNLDNKYPYLLWIPYSYLTAIGPLIFLYTKSLLQNQFKISSQEIILFLPAAIELTLQVIQITYSSIHDIVYYNAPSDFLVSIIIYIASSISIFYHSRRAIRDINSHENWVEANFSDIRNVTLSWLHKLLSHYRVLWLLWIPFATVFIIFFRFQIQNLALIAVIYVLILAITYLTYWIGIEGLRRIDQVFFHPKDSLQDEIRTYDTIPNHEIKRHVDAILHLMVEDQVYLNENLSLRDLSGQLGVDPNLLSYILNTHIKMSFHEFINSYRVEEVKNKLGQSKYKNYTLLAVALESGFNSKTSFNRVFKQITGLTPSQYQKRLNSE